MKAKNLKNWKKLMILGGIACFSMAALFSPVTTLTVEASANEAIEPRADDIQWRFITVGGKLYRRLFNYTTGMWLTDDWEYVGEV